jgi:hypothetical protein
MTSYEGLEDREIAHALLASLRVDYQRPSNVLHVVQSDCPYRVRGGMGLEASSALLDRGSGAPLVLVEAMGPNESPSQLAAAIDRARRLLAFVGRSSSQGGPMPEVWLCLPKPLLSRVRQKFPALAVKWVAYEPG